jgi:glycosyltransferase involved in cell wall biosynthesis
MKTKVLALPRYDVAGASSRVRLYQFLGYLSAHGIDVEVQPLLDERYVRRMLSGGRRSIPQLARMYGMRIRRLLRSSAADVIWLEKELFPWAPQILDPGLVGSVPYVVDYDDAIFHNYDEHSNWFLRMSFGGKIPKVMRNAVTVVAGNAYIRDFALAHGAKRVEVIPSVVDGGKFTPVLRRRTRGEGLTVGWIGSPSTQHLLDPLVPVLVRELSAAGDRFVTIGARFDRPLFAAHEALIWSEANEARLIADFDVGVMPLRDAPFERGKCGFKLVQYMACGVPVIASPVGVNSSMVRDGVNGFLASTETDWAAAIRAMKAEPKCRFAMGVSARAIFEAEYSFAVHAPRFADILRAAAASR